MTNSKLIYIEDDQILGNLITQALVDYGFEIDFRTTLNGLQESLASMLPDQLLIELGGHKIWMEHGHLVPNLMTLAFRAKDHGADIALFGHTHEPLCEYAYGVMLLNPGSAGNRCRGGAARASLLLLDKDKIRVEDIL